MHRPASYLLRDQQRVNWTEALGEVLGIVGKVLRRSSLHLGHFDGGDAQWLWTFEFLPPHQGLIMRLAAALMRAQVLDGDEIDALMHDHLNERGRVRLTCGRPDAAAAMPDAMRRYARSRPATRERCKSAPSTALRSRPDAS